MIVFAGHDRRYTLPASLRAPGRDQVTGWEILSLAQQGDPWAEEVLETLMPHEVDEGEYSAVPDPEDEDILRVLLRTSGENIEAYTPETGEWVQISDDDGRKAIDVDQDTASALYDSLQAGGSGLVLRFCDPVAWLPPSNDLPAFPLTAAAPDTTDTGSWKYFAVVDDLDHGAVLNIIRLAAGPMLESYTEQGWEEDNALLADLKGVTPPLLVAIEEANIADLTRQADEFYAAHPGKSEDDTVTASIEEDGYDYSDGYDEIEMEDDGVEIPEEDESLTAATKSYSNRQWRGTESSNKGSDKSSSGKSSNGKWDEEKHPRGEAGSTEGGQFVKAMQKSLIKSGYLGAHDGKNGNGADGIKGKKTTAAIKKWQKLHGRKVTGNATADEARSITHPHEFASKKSGGGSSGGGGSGGSSGKGGKTKTEKKAAAAEHQKKVSAAQAEVDAAATAVRETTKDVNAATRTLATAQALAKAEPSAENDDAVTKDEEVLRIAKQGQKRATAELKRLRARLKAVQGSGYALIAVSGTSPLPGVSPDPRAEKLRRYWSIGGKGGLKIKWNIPGDWTRCYHHLAKYMGIRAKGYCALLHKRNTGTWTGSKLNASAGISMVALETTLLAALETKLWFSETNGKATDMQDGIYSEVVEGADAALVETLLAGGFPVTPPDEWFNNPKLEGPTPITITADGQVYGHIATFDIAHIGMPGNVRAPKSRSGYAYFHTGDMLTASGQHVPVGQLTLAGGHAPLSADASEAVKHYDDTASAIADIHVGEDRFGIWAAGAVRPEATAEQVRALRASAPSGDWRPINGNLELVAICQVNVPGFPVARAQVASGRVTALVAAGARPLAEQRQANLADAALASRVDKIEALIAAGEIPVAEPVAVPVVDPVVVSPEAEVVDTAADVPEVEDQVKARIEAARQRVKDRKRQQLRDRVHPVAAAGTL